MRLKNALQNLSLSLAALLCCLVVLECGLRAVNLLSRTSASLTPASARKDPPLHVVTDSPEIYVLNPAHPDVSSQGFRNAEVATPKPADELRILILGDSVTFGHKVRREKTFSSRLGERLKNPLRPTQVINAGVSGYTAYNELQSYLVRGRKLQPDLVLVAFCMNDVVNPRLHWNVTMDRNLDIPDEAIPNHEYDVNHILPKMQRLQLERNTATRKRKESFPEYLALYRFLQDRLGSFFKNSNADLPGVPPAAPTPASSPDPLRTKAPQNVPTFLTGEDTLSIEVLLDSSSPERQWLESIYNRLNDAVQEDGATMAIVFLPLSYQLAEGYPYLPQKELMAYCEQQAIPCIDLLPALKRYSREEVFLLKRRRRHDIWHLSEAGHTVAAEEIYRFLEEKNLLRGGKKKD